MSQSKPFTDDFAIIPNTPTDSRYLSSNKRRHKLISPLRLQLLLFFLVVLLFIIYFETGYVQSEFEPGNPVELTSSDLPRLRHLRNRRPKNQTFSRPTILQQISIFEKPLMTPRNQNTKKNSVINVNILLKVDQRHKDRNNPDEEPPIKIN